MNVMPRSGTFQRTWHQPQALIKGAAKTRLQVGSSGPLWRNHRRWYATPDTGKQGLSRDDGREKVVILGSGWAGYVLSRRLDPKRYRVVVISPRSYFVFTPLLSDTCVGTLEFRNVLESVRKRNSATEYIQGWADDVNFADKTVTVEPSVLDPDVGRAMTGPREPNIQQTSDGHTYGDNAEMIPIQLGGTGQKQVPTFPVGYDKLVIAVGAYTQTFNTKGVKENACFLKDVGDAVAIRNRILELFELASLPIIPEQVKRYLLHFVVVGAGPTGMEVAASLSDLIKDDISKLYQPLLKYIRITIYDVAPKVLPMFDASLADYAVKHYKRRNIEIKTSHQVEELRKGMPNDPEARDTQDKQVKGRVYTIRTKQEGDVGIGICIWSTGNQVNPFVKKALDHVRRFPVDSAHITQGDVADPMHRQWIIQRDARTGTIMVDDHFRVNLTVEKAPDSQDSAPEAYMKDVFAVGDTTKLISGALPATAQVANQQALWLGKALNQHPDAESYTRQPGFAFKNMGVLTYVGGAKALLQGGSSDDGAGKRLKGWVAFLIWRGAYLTMTLSWRNKFLVPVQWLIVKLFGRDTSRW